FVLILNIVMAVLSSGRLALAQSVPEGTKSEVEGTIRTVAGEPIAGVSVRFQAVGPAKATEAKTGPEGPFIVSLSEPGSYVVSAAKPGWRTVTTPALIVSPGAKRRIDLTLENPESGHQAAAGSLSGSMKLHDEPDFVVAGVTDGTNMGGHGSDTTRLTSDALAKDTVALKASTSRDTSVAPPRSAAPDMESKLRAELLKRPESYETNQQLGDFYFRSQRYREAIPLLETAYRVHPDDFANAYNLALAYQEQGELARAQAQVKRMLASFERPELHHLLGDLDEQLDDPLAAVHEYEQATRHDANEQNYFDWGAELLLHRAPQAALEVFTKGASAHPNSSRMLVGLGATLYANGSYEEAAERLCAASDLSPKDSVPYIFLGQIQKSAPVRSRCADMHLARFVKEQPENALANYYYAIVLWKNGRQSQSASELQRAYELLKHAVNIDPKLSDAHLLLGIMASDKGELQQAISEFTQAVTTNYQLLDAHYRLGLAYKQSGETAKAQQEFQVYNELSKEESALHDRERRELRQYLISLKNHRPSDQ
ncbi:MAG TPA: tetratricopeptide repeat protein, partial [Terriglobales bacterium]